MTDAKASTRTATVDVPDATNVIATYDGVTVNASPNPDAANAFLTWFAPVRTARPSWAVRPGARHDRGPHRAFAGPPECDRALRTGLAAHRGRWGERSLTALAGLFALFLGLPVATLLARAILTGSFGVALATPAVVDALWLSLVTTAIGLVITVTLGLPLAGGACPAPVPGQGRRGSGRGPADRSPSVAGLALLLVFGRRGLLAAPFEFLGISVPFTTIAVILAMTFVSAPFFVRSARIGIAGVDRDLEDAARVDGASELHLFRSITVPLAGAALAGGLVMSWARAR